MSPKRSWFAAVPCSLLALKLAGCGGGYDSQIKTPEDRVAEQERLAYEEEQRRRNRPQTVAPPPEEERAGAFDRQQAELELKRATLSAETCSEVVVGSDVPYGDTSVTLTFANDGSVGEASIPPPFAGSRIAECVLNAYRAVIVPPYTGELEVMTWDVSLKAPKPSDAKSTKKKK